LNSFLRETLGYAADFLDRPTDEVGHREGDIVTVFCRDCRAYLRGAAKSSGTRTPIPAQGGQQSGDCGQQVMAA
jgi:hypothetical protein